MNLSSHGRPEQRDDPEIRKARRVSITFAQKMMIFLQLAIALISACGVIFFAFFGLVAFGFSCSNGCDFLATAPIVLGCAGIASILVVVASLAFKRIKSIKSNEVNLKKSFNLRETLLLVMRAWLVVMAMMVTMFVFMN